jgi:hypothetical protein
MAWFVKMGTLYYASGVFPRTHLSLKVIEPQKKLMEDEVWLGL